ncbi:hypothetical protein RSOLAG1IB_08741 [Rhizoctonia solani AG-1 IB]|uniref:Uncharacterized protein n=1 Tax=Thanatephorus cucumeris (strain AG1-IB / isolate 7/3/14) TaxID=1108050 RepID=A0A0B7FR93_THACB|nr:hypothetical protein RSOLAG1IB_08741 [Rhizoctonia solani AG-1 IB]
MDVTYCQLIRGPIQIPTTTLALTMVDCPGWYPSGQVCYPPELPAYLSNVYDLKPIVGLPSDAEVIGIHAVLYAARKASEIPGMHDPGLLMGLADHLFGAQMARYRSKHSLITFPSDATYSPPTLPTHLLKDSTYAPPPLPVHVAVQLEPITKSPSEEEVIKVQTAIRTYQQFANVPSLFDPHVDMDLSQHLFDIQMTRYTQRARQNYVGSKSDETLVTNSVTILQ